MFLEAQNKREIKLKATGQSGVTQFGSANTARDYIEETGETLKQLEKFLENIVESSKVEKSVLEQLMTNNQMCTLANTLLVSTAKTFAADMNQLCEIVLELKR